MTAQDLRLFEESQGFRMSWLKGGQFHACLVAAGEEHTDRGSREAESSQLLCSMEETAHQ